MAKDQVEAVEAEVKKEKKPKKEEPVSPEVPKLTASLVDVVAQEALNEFEDMIKSLAQNSMNMQYLPKLKKIQEKIKFVLKAKG